MAPTVEELQAYYAAQEYKPRQNCGRKPGSPGTRSVAVESCCSHGGAWKFYPRIKDAAKEHGITPAAIGHVLRGERPTAAGRRWRRKEKLLQTEATQVELLQEAAQ